MTDNELLLAMSNMMDDKLKPVNDKLEGVEQAQEEMSGRLERVEQKQEEMSGKMDSMNDRLKKVEITQENIILPRLQNIEAGYISTYKRYQEGVDQIQTMQNDISVIKKVVVEHSDRLHKFRVVKH